MATSLRNSFLGSAYYKMIEKKILPHLLRADLTPNQMTVVGSMIAGLVPFGFFAHPVLGLVLLIISATADSLDGMVARRRKLVSSDGAFLDSSLDRLSDVFFLTGFWVMFWAHPNQHLTAGLFIVSILTTFMISYVKARAEALGVDCRIGLMERGVRVLYLIAWALLIIIFPTWRAVCLWGGLLLYIALTLTTVIQRMFYVRSRMRGTYSPQ